MVSVSVSVRVVSIGVVRVGVVTVSVGNVRVGTTKYDAIHDNLTWRNPAPTTIATHTVHSTQ